MSAEKDRNTYIKHGVFYSVEEMIYLCAVQMEQYPNNSVLKKGLEPIMQYLESLPIDSSVSYGIDPNTNNPRFSISFLGAKWIEGSGIVE